MFKLGDAQIKSRVIYYAGLEMFNHAILVHNA
jgi:hypothetical protein